MPDLAQRHSLARKLRLAPDGSAVADAATPEATAPQSIQRAFAPLIAARAGNQAFVLGQLGLSLDGRIATATGKSQYINGRDALNHLHQMRALCDGVIVGAGTVRADDPQLTVRYCDGVSPARIVIDPNGTVGPTSKVWADDGARRIVFGGSDGLPDGIERLDAPRGDIPVADILGRLAELGLSRVLVEGGADTLRRFLAAGAIDSLHLLYGRVIIGSGKAGLTLDPIDALDDALRPSTDTHVFDDGDLLVACHLR